MARYTFPKTDKRDDRPFFTSNGIRGLVASSDTVITLLDIDVLKEKFGAELLLDNVKMNPYWQIGECVGGIYRLAHFPLDGQDCDLQGLYVFNAVPSEEYRAACKDPNVITVGSVCEIILNCALLGDRFMTGPDEWYFEMSDNVAEAVVRANKGLQEIVDKYRK